MSLKANKSYVYFVLKDGDFDPDIVSHLLDITPTKIRRKGDTVGKSKKELEFSAWYLYSELRDNLFVNEQVKEVVEKLYNKTEAINTAKSNFGLISILEIVLYVDTNENTATPRMGHDLKTIEFLYKTQTETDVDMYKY